MLVGSLFEGFRESGCLTHAATSETVPKYSHIALAYWGCVVVYYQPTEQMDWIHPSYCVWWNLVCNSFSSKEPKGFMGVLVMGMGDGTPN